MGILPGSMMTCQNGYTPSLTCGNPVPADELCACTCHDGATFNQTRPSPSDIVVPIPALGPPRQIVGDELCTGKVIIPWSNILLDHKKDSYEPSEKSSHDIDVSEDSLLMVADSDRRCQHFEVYIDGQLVGVTSGTGVLVNKKCGTPEECVKDGASFGYFTLPKGKRNIEMKWIGIVDACKHIKTAAGSYQVYEKCNKTTTQ